jgi:4-hydroxyphenylpyruvate dioxygenase
MSVPITGHGFVEFASPEPQALHDLFRRMGFVAVKKHRSQPITVYRQGDIDFLVNETPDSFASDFADRHGPSACGFAILFEDADAAKKQADERGAKPIEINRGLNLPAIEGIGGAALYLADRQRWQQLLAEDFEDIAGVPQNPTGFGLTFVDHLTHNVYSGEMEEWAEYYTRLFDFEPIRYFDIRGEQTGLLSKAMRSPGDAVKIPINESSDPKSQINEYLEEYKGQGIQHIALFTDNIYETIESMQACGVDFLDTPDTYYSIIDQRIPGHNEDVARMQKNRILIDADPETGKKILLQIFTKNAIGPIFFEIIQRKGNQGFGEGNFKALFESIELDQKRRGYLT